MRDSGVGEDSGLNLKKHETGCPTCVAESCVAVWNSLESVSDTGNSPLSVGQERTEGRNGELFCSISKQSDTTNSFTYCDTATSSNSSIPTSSPVSSNASSQLCTHEQVTISNNRVTTNFVFSNSPTRFHFDVIPFQVGFQHFLRNQAP